jgi:hypothetical protein
VEPGKSEVVSSEEGSEISPVSEESRQDSGTAGNTGMEPAPALTGGKTTEKSLVVQALPGGRGMAASVNSLEDLNGACTGSNWWTTSRKEPSGPGLWPGRGDWI